MISGQDKNIHPPQLGYSLTRLGICSQIKRSESQHVVGDPCGNMTHEHTDHKWLNCDEHKWSGSETKYCKDNMGHSLRSLMDDETSRSDTFLGTMSAFWQLGTSWKSRGRIQFTVGVFEVQHRPPYNNNKKATKILTTHIVEVLKPEYTRVSWQHLVVSVIC